MRSLKHKCYNSGKIGGIPYLQAYKKFQVADEKIFLMDMIPVNPMKSKLKPNRPWILHMLLDVYMLLGCKYVYMQSDWKESRGARIEMRMAKLARKIIIIESDTNNK